ncbi:MAG: YigZ family protein [Gammaproteobacteria bacterium]|nr:YigZ family protein [Gammaproteobacteria bacterium]
MSYREPRGVSEVETIVKKSRFIGYARKILSRHDALEFVGELKLRYTDARHVCWAYLIGNPSNSANAGCNDDGEPSGTAGKPILAQIQYNNIGNVAVCVVRYFGGIRLGAGGLVRAYRESANLALTELDTSEFTPSHEYIIKTSFEEEHNVRRYISNCDGNLLNCDYNNGVEILAVIPDNNLTEFRISLKNSKSVLHIAKK